MTILASHIPCSSLLSTSGSGSSYSFSHGQCWATAAPLSLGEAVHSSQCQTRLALFTQETKYQTLFTPLSLDWRVSTGMWERQRTALMCLSHSFSLFFGEFGPSFSCHEILAVFSMKSEVFWWEVCLKKLLINVITQFLRTGGQFCFEIALFQVLCKLDPCFLVAEKRRGLINWVSIWHQA